MRNGVAEVVKGYFKFTLADHIFTVTAVGVTKVRFPKQGTWGAFVTLDLTGRSFTIYDDGHASEQFIGLNGTTASVAWANICPWQVCLINKDNTAASVRMALTRDWTESFNKTPASGNNIGDNTTVAVTSSYINFIICDNITPAEWVDLPSVAIGGITATKDASATGVWDISALSSTTGYGKFNENVTFAYPVAQNGNDAGSYFIKGAGTTTPKGSSQTSTYIISGGMCTFFLHVYGGDLNGDGANEAHAATPIPMRPGFGGAVGNGYAYISGGSTFYTTLVQCTASGYIYAYVYISVSVLTLSDFNDNNDQWLSGITYPI